MTLRFDVRENNKNVPNGYRIHPAVVTYMKDGKQKRKVFKDVKQAKLYYKRLQDGEKTLGQSFYDLKPSEASIAHNAYMRAKENGYDIYEALSFYEAKTKNNSNAIIDDVVDMIIDLNEKKLNSTKYKKGFNVAVTRFAECFSGRRLDDITTEEIEDYTNDPEKGWSITTKEYNKRLITVFYNMAKGLKYTISNPVMRMSKKESKKANSSYIEFFTPEEARILLRVAADKKPEYIVPLVLTLFNGLRMDTSTRMIVRDIHIDYDKIVIPDAIEKTYGRSIDMLPNTKAWLKKFLPQAKLPLFGGDMIPERLAADNYNKFCQWCEDVRSSWDTVRAYLVRYSKLNGGRWPKNGHRHAFCTYHLALHGDASKTSYMAGNTPKMLNEHYDGKLFKKELAEEWFNITPENTL